MTSLNFEHFLTLSPQFYYRGLSTIVTKTLTPSPIFPTFMVDHLMDSVISFTSNPSYVRLTNFYDSTWCHNVIRKPLREV
jgi:hypothetical protein